MAKLTGVTPKIIFFFGLAGSGKSYLINLLSKETGWNAYDADKDLTSEMLSALKKKQEFTDEMRFQYIESVVGKINKLAKNSDKLLIAQANYKFKYREYVRDNIEASLEFIEVKAKEEIIYKRLKGRDDELTPDYFKMIAKNFEPAKSGVKVLVNNGDDAELINNFINLYL